MTLSNATTLTSPPTNGHANGHAKKLPPPRLEAMGQDDIDSVMSLGVTQIGRVFGIMDHNIMKVLWWDPDHLVCPVEVSN